MPYIANPVSLQSSVQPSKLSSRVSGKLLSRDTAEARIESRRNALHLAAGSGDLAAVQRLIAHNASGINQSDRLGFTPLHLAVSAGSPSVVRTLLGAGARKSINAVAFAGYTPLAIACGTSGVSKPDLARMLIECGAKTDVYVSGFGASRHAPLHLAALKGHVQIVTMLVESGVDVNQTLEGGAVTALALASQYGHHETAAYLQSKGGVISSRRKVQPEPVEVWTWQQSPTPKRSTSPQSPFLMAQELKRKRQLAHKESGAESALDSNPQVARPE